MTTATNYLTRAQFSACKSRLTRAIRSGNSQRVLAVVEETFAEWDAGDFAYPDDWHRWERARFDAEMALRRERY
jgi:hypothetical protein